MTTTPEHTYSISPYHNSPHFKSWIVKNKYGVIIGSVEKLKDTKKEQHPFKAVLGIGADRKMVGVSFNRKTRGKEDAAKKVLEAWLEAAPDKKETRP